MTSTGGPQRIDPVDRAHLTGRSRPTPPIHRYAPSPDLADLVTRYWLPVWSLPRPLVQRTLQYPVCLMVTTPEYARLYGVARGVSEVTLDGDGWAVGVLLTPAAGRLLLERPVAELTDRHVDLAEVPSVGGAALVEELRAAMGADPRSDTAHAAAVEAVERRLRALLPVDDEGLLVNRVVAWVQEHPEVARVADLAAAFDLGERALQRLVERRVGITPKWLIQRRRLHDAVERLKAGGTTIADLAAELGYADQAHFTHDFKAVSGMTPGEYLADQDRPR